MSKSLELTPPQTEQVFGNTELAEVAAQHGETFLTEAGVQLQFGDERLGLREHFVKEEVDGVVRYRKTENYEVVGNTVPRLCGALGSCAAAQCGLAELRMTFEQRRDKDCADANAMLAFGGRQGFLITPTNNEVMMLAQEASYDEVVTVDENGERQVMFGKVKPASVLIIGEHDIPEEGVFVGANNADNSLIATTFVFDGVRYALVSSTSRLNLGDRDADAQLMRKAIEQIADRHGLEGVERQRAIADLKIRFDVGYQASLRNFAHQVRVPEEGSEAARALMEANGLSSYEELTPTIVMSSRHGGQYPGALEHGEIYGAFEAENDIDSPRKIGGCPGHGELCYIHYPKITERTQRTQLEEMGVSAENITYDASRSIDPASVDNRLASNRRMQLAGVPLNKTLRSINGVAVRFP